MLFNSFAFLFAFLPLVYIGSQLLRRYCPGPRQLAISGWLFLASLFFYVQSDAASLLLISISIAFNYLIGRGIDSNRKPCVRYRLLVFGVLVNLAAIAWFKYANFIYQSLTGILGQAAEPLTIVLPIGISFFTFTQIAYLVDVYREPGYRYDPVRYGLFVTFFPHLIAGPILHHKEMIGQFSGDEARKDGSDFAAGFSLFVLGLGKKILLADTFALPANVLFDAAAAGNPPSIGAAWTGVLCYTFQLYFDFSAYSDMAVGLARMFGLRFPINFASPYKATNIIDFWRRWHITLSRFLRDYLYIPLGGNQAGRARQLVNLMLTMLLGGLWHGAGWTFILWGGLHGLYLIGNRLWQVSLGQRIRMPVWLACSVTMGFVILAWVPFRAVDMDSCWSIWKAMFGFGSASPATGLELRHLGWALVGFLICWVLPNTNQIMGKHDNALPSPGYPATGVKGGGRWYNWQPNLGWAVLIAVLFTVSVLKLNDLSHFIYFQF
jgi:D-alanyl-lipoteichoic acid acyltransferase DltB (MBOAT superfamily)